MVHTIFPITPSATGLPSSTPTISKKVEILVEVHAVLKFALERPHAHLVGAVHVVDVATPQFLKLVAECVVGVGA